MSQEAKHPGGRPRQGLTRKVSLTLTEAEWAAIDNSGKTVAAFLKDLMKVEAAIPSGNPKLLQGGSKRKH